MARGAVWKKKLMYYQLTDQFEVKAEQARTWAFFSDAANLPLITPAWLGFTVRTPGPIALARDSVIDYTVSWLGIPIGWRTRIIDWSPPRQFIDLQLRGPYALWHHQHTFSASDAGTLCADRVIYKLPGGPIGQIAHAAVVRRQLLEIFNYRRRVVGEKLGWVRPIQKDVRVERIG